MLRNRVVAAGAVLVVLVGAVAIVLRQPAQTSGPAPTLGTPGVTSPSPDLRAAPTEVGGLPVRSVADALTLRDAGATGPIAVVGWGVRFDVPCPMPMNAYMPLESCVYRFTWLMAEPEVLMVRRPDGSGSINPPTGPAFNLAYSPPDAGVDQAMVVIGHFHDPRAMLCPAGDRRDACGRLFVVDSAAWLGPIAPEAPAESQGPAASQAPAATEGG